MSKTYYMQGGGTLNDAVFQVLDNGFVHVTAEVGVSGCYDDTLHANKAREVWASLVAKGWKRVAKPRRSVRLISDSING